MARTYTTSSNSSFAYEQAVALHNKGWISHRIYQSHPEKELRGYVTAYLLKIYDKEFREMRGPNAVASDMEGRNDR
jgi:hypothetical protein